MFALQVALLLATSGLIASPALTMLLNPVTESAAEETERSVEVLCSVQKRARRVCRLQNQHMDSVRLHVADMYRHNLCSPTPTSMPALHLIGSGICILC